MEGGDGGAADHVRRHPRRASSKCAPRRPPARTRRSCCCTARPAARASGPICSRGSAHSPARSRSTCPATAASRPRLPSRTPSTPTPASSAARSTALGIVRAHLVMNDIGGAGLRWAADHPQAVGSTVQIDTGIVNQLRRWHLVGLLLRTPGVGWVGERLGRPLLGPTFRLFDPLPARERQRLAAGFDRHQRRALRTMYRAVPVDVGAALAPRLALLGRPALVVWARGTASCRSRGPISGSPSRGRGSCCCRPAATTRTSTTRTRSPGSSCRSCASRSAGASARRRASRTGCSSSRSAGWRRRARRRGRVCAACR